ncbi:hypothetical protein RJT34_23528 [Clitoria ternatea]|uniref:Uncharacterized protein n=1 Tax=Clitoria ternatea TaxID=43366 RepID=A0AAN9IF25_CLITE
MMLSWECGVPFLFLSLPNPTHPFSFSLSHETTALSFYSLTWFCGLALENRQRVLFKRLRFPSNQAQAFIFLPSSSGLWRRGLCFPFVFAMNVAKRKTFRVPLGFVLHHSNGGFLL